MTDSTHEQQLQQLIDATTDLTEAVNVNKLVLDSAVDSATGSAQSAANASNIAVNAKEEAKTAVTEAKKAEANATAIVHNDEGHTTPTPGAYPVADSNGHLDIGWTPLLAAMYPHSGVIGSVDKNYIASFYHSEDGHANRIWFNLVEYNIAGRLVKLKPTSGSALHSIKLANAESTADRAIAFDDIFLDWNGNVQTYRSITPHRTTTGYDRDAIATEHGYSKIQTGLYKTGDTYALLLGRVARRNKGAYHPVFNKEGTASFWTLDVAWGGGTWFQTVSTGFVTSKDSCFDMKGVAEKTPGAPFLGSGNISTGQTSVGYLGSPDKKPHDAIYADDFTPLYYSAKNVIDRQALLFDSFNRAVAGETFSGAESLPDNNYVKTTTIADDLYTTTSNTPYWGGITTRVHLTDNINKDIPINALEAVNNHGEKNARYYLSGVLIVQGVGSFKIVGYEDFSKGLFYLDTSYGDIAKSLRGQNCTIQLHFTKTARPQFLMCDIIGSLDDMPDEWKTQGIPGNWLAVGEEGESLIPDGTEKNFKLSRKCLECYQVLYTSDGGSTWEDATATWKPLLESSANARATSIIAPYVHIIFYRTSANPFELTKNSNLTALGDVWANTRGNVPALCLLSSHLIGKVTTNSNGYKQKTIPLSESNLDRKTDGYCHLFGGNHAGGEPIHAPINLTNLTLHIPAIKTLPVLTKDGYMQIVYKEMKHNGTQWGDDNKFDIVDNQSTVTDLNGETVIVGQKRVELPYIFDGVTY